MPLDINQFRADKGGDVEELRRWHAARYKDPATIDKIIKADKDWRELIFQKDNLKKELNSMSKQIGVLKKAKQDATAQMTAVKDKKAELKECETKAEEAKTTVDKLLYTVGNSVHESVPVNNDEEHNEIVATWGECKQTGKELHHHELLHMIGGYNSTSGVTVAGHRGYFLTGVGVLLNQALINFGLAFSMKRDFTPVQPPYMMRKEVMAETAQLEQFDEELYHVSGGNEDMYLIATSEQPISAFHRGDWMSDAELPKRYGGYSTCFRKEAGSHGKDTWGIFRIHQFEKVEQFVLTAPEDSWDMHDKMIKNSQEFYQALGLPYRVVVIVSGELNNAAAKKYDLEAWFPTLGVFRELVSCSNCTDYQSRAMETRFGQKKMGDREKKYVHMLNSTLTATERTICCILENYQCDEGVRVPEPLQPFMGGMKLMPFINEKPVNTGLEQRKKAAKRKANKGQEKKKNGGGK
jgi:seryl-tRNA synthetase